MYIAESLETPCQMSDPRLWFAKPGTAAAMVAKRACFDCAERDQCIDSVVRYEQKTGQIQYGIYGGYEPQERTVFLDLSVVTTA